MPKTWTDHLEDATRALNNRILPALKHTPKELLLGLVVDTKRTDPTDSTTQITATQAAIQMAYAAQQRLDGYDEALRHALKRKTTFDKRVLQRHPSEVTFIKGQLVQVYRNDLDYTFKTDRKLLPKWSQPRRVTERLQNSYQLETLTGSPLPGLYHARRLRAFIPREGSQLYNAQQVYMQQLREENKTENEEGIPWEDKETSEDTDERAVERNEEQTPEGGDEESEIGTERTEAEKA